jgi:hypothetical protein
MSSFTVDGVYDGRNISILWEDSVFSGDDEFIAHVRALASNMEGFPLRWATEPATITNHLASAGSSFALCIKLLKQSKEPISCSGDVPGFNLPKGVVA